MDTTFVYSFSTNEPSTFSKILPFITLILGAIITLGVTQITKYCSNKVHRKKTKLSCRHSKGDALADRRSCVADYTWCADDSFLCQHRYRAAAPSQRHFTARAGSIFHPPLPRIGRGKSLDSFLHLQFESNPGRLIVRGFYFIIISFLVRVTNA